MQSLRRSLGTGTLHPKPDSSGLLRETSVPAGLLVSPDAIRLVYAPKGESSGHITFKTSDMVQVCRPSDSGGVAYALVRRPALHACSGSAATSFVDRKPEAPERRVDKLRSILHKRERLSARRLRPLRWWWGLYRGLGPRACQTMSSRTARTAPDAHTMCFCFRTESIFICYFSCTWSCRAAQRFLPPLTLSNLLETLSGVFATISRPPAISIATSTLPRLVE